MPSRRACGLHAFRALEVAAQRGLVDAAIKEGHLSDDDTHVNEMAWAASPSFDPEQIQVFLQDALAAAGDNDVEGDAFNDVGASS